MIGDGLEVLDTIADHGGIYYECDINFNNMMRAAYGNELIDWLDQYGGEWTHDLDHFQFKDEAIKVLFYLRWGDRLRE